LLVVAHISVQPPAASDYESAPVASRARAATKRCNEEADKVIYHDVEDVGDRDRGYVEEAANFMMATDAGYGFCGLSRSPECVAPPRRTEVEK